MKMYDRGALIKVKISSITQLVPCNGKFTAAHAKAVQKFSGALIHATEQV